MQEVALSVQNLKKQFRLSYKQQKLQHTDKKYSPR